jgi:hypothetical protein
VYIGITTGGRVLKVDDKVREQLRGEDLWPQERLHQGLVGGFPLIAVRLYLLAIFFDSYQVGDFMDEGHQKAVLVQAGINGNFMLTVGQALVIPMPALALLDDF